MHGGHLGESWTTSCRLRSGSCRTCAGGGPFGGAGERLPLGRGVASVACDGLKTTFGGLLGGSCAGGGG
eukprot:3718748-Alexandrium_andersonii.AAC.1